MLSTCEEVSGVHLADVVRKSLAHVHLVEAGLEPKLDVDNVDASEVRGVNAELETGKTELPVIVITESVPEAGKHYGRIGPIGRTVLACKTSGKLLHSGHSKGLTLGGLVHCCIAEVVAAATLERSQRSGGEPCTAKDPAYMRFLDGCEDFIVATRIGMAYIRWHVSVTLWGLREE